MIESQAFVRVDREYVDGNLNQQNSKTRLTSHLMKKLDDHGAEFVYCRPFTNSEILLHCILTHSHDSKKDVLVNVLKPRKCIMNRRSRILR